MRKAFAPMLFISFLSLPLAASAATQMKPGLWEMTMKSDAMKNMPQIPPEQMEQMRKMGVNIPQMQNGGIVSKVCITRQMAESEEMPGMDKSLGCQSKNYQRNPGSYSVDIVCDGPDMKGTGRLKGRFANDRSFSSTYSFKGSMHGQPINQNTETSGKWLGEDCGSVKPVVMPKK